MSTLSLVFFGLVQPLLGHLSDRVGRRPMLLAFTVLFGLGVVPGLALVRSSDSFGGLLAVSLLGMLALGASADGSPCSSPSPSSWCWSPCRSRPTTSPTDRAPRPAHVRGRESQEFHVNVKDPY